MKTLFYSVKIFEKPYLEKASLLHQDATFIKDALGLKTVQLAKGYDAVSIFTGDDASAPVISDLHQQGVKFISTRAAGYDNISLPTAEENNMRVANVPEYSPHAIAEHAVALLLAVNRKLIVADKQVHEHNFTVDNLVGFDLNQKTVGIIGLGKIGGVFAKIMHGFGCRILAYDIEQNEVYINDYGVNYVSLVELCQRSDVISIHVPLNAHTKYLINADLFGKMKKGVILINTGRGAVVNTADLIDSIEKGDISGCGMDVYEKEKGIFFYDKRNEPLNDPMLEKLLRFSNVLVTPHHAFTTEEALSEIAATTFANLDAFAKGDSLATELTKPQKAKVQGHG